MRWNRLFFVCLVLVLSMATSAMAQDKPQFRSDMLTQVDIGNLDAGRYSLRATITVVEPRAKIPSHVHKSPGIRYVLEGALTINWQKGTTQTYSAGSTYYEGPGENHPVGLMAAANPTSGVTKILIIELLRAK